MNARRGGPGSASMKSAIAREAMRGAIKAAEGRPPIGARLTNIATLAMIAVVGAAHLGPLQIYGGIFGVAMFAIAAFNSGR